MIYNGDPGLGDLRDVVDRAVQELGRVTHRFDVIAVRGMSGVIVGSAVALALHRKLAVVRKPDESSHSARGSVVGASRVFDGRYIFLDDFVETGSTRQAVIDAMARLDCVHVGDYLYDGWDERLTMCASEEG